MWSVAEPIQPSLQLRTALAQGEAANVRPGMDCNGAIASAVRRRVLRIRGIV
jgi:hypothetical protein